MKDIQFNERKLHGLPEFPFQYYSLPNTKTAKAEPIKVQPYI